MVLFMWNVRGFNGIKIRREVHTLMVKMHVEIMRILESKVKKRNQAKDTKLFEDRWANITNVKAWEATKVNFIWVMWNPTL